MPVESSGYAPIRFDQTWTGQRCPAHDGRGHRRSPSPRRPEPPSLPYVNHETVTNTTIRDRFGIEPHNAARASRLINEAAEAGMIRARDPRRPRSCQQHLPAGGPKLGPSIVRRSRGKRSDIGLPPAIPGALYGPKCAATPWRRPGNPGNKNTKLIAQIPGTREPPSNPGRFSAVPS